MMMMMKWWNDDDADDDNDDDDDDDDYDDDDDDDGDDDDVDAGDDDSDADVVAPAWPAWHDFLMMALLLLYPDLEINHQNIVKYHHHHDDDGNSDTGYQCIRKTKNDNNKFIEKTPLKSDLRYFYLWDILSKWWGDMKK